MKYIAFLRGIAPANPNMRNEKLRRVFEDLGFENVQTVISSGNVLFDSSSKNKKSMEARIENAWPEKLGFHSTTIIRSQEEIQNLIAKNPFDDLDHCKETYLLATFLKNPLEKPPMDLPCQNERKTAKILSFDRDLQLFCSTVDTSGSKTPDFMVWAEKQFGKQISSRTWKTVLRIADKMEKQH